MDWMSLLNCVAPGKLLVTVNDFNSFPSPFKKQTLISKELTSKPTNNFMGLNTPFDLESLELKSWTL
jgi:hypothetical protein